MKTQKFLNIEKILNVKDIKIISYVSDLNIVLEYFKTLFAVDWNNTAFMHNIVIRTYDKLSRSSYNSMFENKSISYFYKTQLNSHRVLRIITTSNNNKQYKLDVYILVENKFYEKHKHLLESTEGIFQYHIEIYKHLMHKKGTTSAKVFLNAAYSFLILYYAFDKFDEEVFKLLAEYKNGIYPLPLLLSVAFEEDNDNVIDTMLKNYLNALEVELSKSTSESVQYDIIKLVTLALSPQFIKSNFNRYEELFRFLYKTLLKSDMYISVASNMNRFLYKDNPPRDKNCVLHTFFRDEEKIPKVLLELANYFDKDMNLFLKYVLTNVNWYSVYKPSKVPTRKYQRDYLNALLDSFYMNNILEDYPHFKENIINHFVKKFGELIAEYRDLEIDKFIDILFFNIGDPDEINKYTLPPYVLEIVLKNSIKTYKRFKYKNDANKFLKVLFRISEKYGIKINDLTSKEFKDLLENTKSEKLKKSYERCIYKLIEQNV